MRIRSTDVFILPSPIQDIIQCQSKAEKSLYWAQQSETRTTNSPINLSYHLCITLVHGKHANELRMSYLLNIYIELALSLKPKIYDLIPEQDISTTLLEQYYLTPLYMWFTNSCEAFPQICYHTGIPVQDCFLLVWHLCCSIFLISNFWPKEIQLACYTDQKKTVQDYCSERKQGKWF